MNLPAARVIALYSRRIVLKDEILKDGILKDDFIMRAKSHSEILVFESCAAK